MTDLAGNAPLLGATSANYTIDTEVPAISSVVLSDEDLKVGETSVLTITFDEAVNNFDNTDITVENGTITAVSSGDGGVTWTATFTPTDDIEDATNVVTIGTAWTDLDGNSPSSGGSSSNYTIDTQGAGDQQCDDVRQRAVGRRNINVDDHLQRSGDRL